MAVSEALKTARHASDLNDSGHDTTRGVPLEFAVECNTSVVLGAPFGFKNPVFDTFYDHSGADTSLVIPAGMGLQMDGDYFQATEDGVWSFDFEWVWEANPGHIGFVKLEHFGYMSGHQIPWLASGNSTTISNATRLTKVLMMATGDEATLLFAGTTGDTVATNVDGQITRIG